MKIVQFFLIMWGWTGSATLVSTTGIKRRQQLYRPLSQKVNNNIMVLREMQKESLRWEETVH
jgi:hypothetical protein